MKITSFFTMKAMKELKKKLHGFHALHGNLSLFFVPVRAWLLFDTDGGISRNIGPAIRYVLG